MQELKTTPSDSADVVSLGDERKVLDVVTSSVLQLWQVVNDLTRLRPTKRDRYQINAACPGLGEVLEI